MPEAARGSGQKDRLIPPYTRGEGTKVMQSRGEALGSTLMTLKMKKHARSMWLRCLFDKDPKLLPRTEVAAFLRKGTKSS